MFRSWVPQPSVLSLGTFSEAIPLSPFSNREIEAARLYHQATSHSHWSVRSAGRELDWSNYPRPFKIYPQLDPIPLPRDFPPTNVPALDPSVTNDITLAHQEAVILSEAKDPETTSRSCSAPPHR